MRVLVVEDNPKMATAVSRGLQEHGYSVDVATTGFEGEELAASGAYDVVLLDLMLPDRDGIEVCRNLRRRRVTIRIILLTALGTTDDKVQGLDAGADDYVTKPFEFTELLARIRSVLRRGDASESRFVRHENLELDLFSRSVKFGAETLKVSNKEFALLEFLVRTPNRVLSRTQIGEKVWDLNFEPTSNIVDVYVSSLRRKLERAGSPPLIHTVKGVGYRFGQAPQ
jgi:DNA-binding response OmpR family regulator